MHDEKTYPDPYAFRPERFLNADGTFNYNIQSPEVAFFGYGRRYVVRGLSAPLYNSSYNSSYRVCPGKASAEAGLFINVATVLHLFDITPPLDKAGNTIHIEPLTIGAQSPDTPPDYYGTRLSTVILVGRDGRTLFIERDIWTLDDENKVTRGDAKKERVFRFHLRA